MYSRLLRDLSGVHARRPKRWLSDGLAGTGQGWRIAPAAFAREVERVEDLLVDALPEIVPLDDAGLAGVLLTPIQGRLEQVSWSGGGFDFGR